MIPAFRSGAALLEEFDADLPFGGLRLWWLGQSGFLIRCGHRRLLLDPYLSDSLTAKYAATTKPHVRMTERVLAPEQLTRIDVVTSSHNHTDHLDRATLEPLWCVNPGMQMLLPEASRAFAAQRLARAGSDFIGLDDGTSAEIGGFQFHGVAAAHNELERDENGAHRFLGYIIRAGRWTIYHSGDTRLYPGLAAKLKAFGQIDLALLPINGDRPERHVAGNLDGKEAAQLGAEIGVGCVIPCHYDLFEFNTADPREHFVPECERLRQPYHVLRVGESWSLSRS